MVGAFSAARQKAELLAVVMREVQAAGEERIEEALSDLLEDFSILQGSVVALERETDRLRAELARSAGKS